MTTRRLLARLPLWWALATLALLAGYTDLVRGGTTLAPTLLVLGYCVLVPRAILR
jgi:hypothetical protein